MFKIDMGLINQLTKGDKINVSWLNKSGETITKKCTFHSIENNYWILVKPPRSKNKVWEININDEAKIERI